MKSVLKIVFVMALVVLMAAPAMAAKKVRWKCATTWSSTLTPLISPPMKLAKLVEEMSGGNFTIRVDGAEKHKAALGILDMVKGGQYDIGHSASYYWKGKDISSVFFTSVPFGMNVQEQHAWEDYGGGKELEKELYDKYKILSFRGGNTGVQMGGWFKKEIKSVDDLKGLKMRIPGLAGEVFAKLGVNVTNIPPGELYTSLDRGTIDALEWVGPAMDIKMGFHKIAPYYYVGWHEPASEMQYLVNKRKYEQLPDEYKAILTTAIRLTAYDMTVENFAGSVEAWEKMKSEYPNIQVKEFPLPVLKAMKKAADELYDEYAAKDPLFKKILESQRAYMKKARKWMSISEFNYIKTSNAVE
ncbi:TRAP transporter substrate-binding protein DctP [Pseudodesulfovibrio sp. zrk46]|uniref:TRAP transporter substrate-binding protein n=1 Tax=Pseudodesulfovibrio sp. zrk46 TaxID=2725288 RepID=UPI001449CD91|nr:TRAP transporter substrate-binding protein DctP [Pseudodesulfovibrio sp. zrk46]QJB56036.1 TRAP transporter substrate-binding protein DctP [Pseudodesulfovibrio sp. zrk46]